MLLGTNRISLSVLLFLITCSLLTACDGEPTVVRSHVVMGTSVTITAWGKDEPTLRRAIGDAFTRMNEIDARMSDYKPDSEISRIKDAAGRELVDTVFINSGRFIAETRESGDGGFQKTIAVLAAVGRSVGYIYVFAFGGPLLEEPLYGFGDRRRHIVFRVKVQQ